MATLSRTKRGPATPEGFSRPKTAANKPPRAPEARSLGANRTKHGTVGPGQPDPPAKEDSDGPRGFPWPAQGGLATKVPGQVETRLSKPSPPGRLPGPTHTTTTDPARSNSESWPPGKSNLGLNRASTRGRRWEFVPQIPARGPLGHAPSHAKGNWQPAQQDDPGAPEIRGAAARPSEGNGGRRPGPRPSPKQAPGKAPGSPPGESKAGFREKKETPDPNNQPGPGGSGGQGFNRQAPF